MKKTNKTFERKMIYVTDYVIEDLIEIMAEGNIDASTWLKKTFDGMCRIKPTSRKEDAKLVNPNGILEFYNLCEKLVDQNIRGFQLMKYAKISDFYEENKFIAKKLGDKLESHMIEELNSLVYGLDLNKAVVSGASKMKEFPKFTREDAVDYINSKEFRWLTGKIPQEDSYVGYTKEDAKAILRAYNSKNKKTEKTKDK